MSPTFSGVLVIRITDEQVRPMLKRESFPIAKIYVPVKRRATLRPEAVRDIAESILEIGQQTPILVRRDEDRFVLVEGLHRLEACKALGEETIVGFLVSAQSNHEKAPSSYDHEADAAREKTERLRKLRLAKEADEKRPTEATKSVTEKPGRSGRMAARGKPATLAGWLADRERDGFRD
jgi:ParB/RepB/Spo0J family partition protein